VTPVRRAAAVLQGLLLGPLLFVGVLWLASVLGSSLVFRYQGF
jgi:hypothetical protein